MGVPVAMIKIQQNKIRGEGEERERLEEDQHDSGKAKLLSPPYPHWLPWPCQLSPRTNCSIRDMRGAAAGQQLSICTEWRGTWKGAAPALEKVRGRGGEDQRRGATEAATDVNGRAREGEIDSLPDGRGLWRGSGTLGLA